MKNMERNMVSLFLMDGEKLLMLHRKGSRIVDGLWIAGCGGHMEKDELNNARAAVLREAKEEMGLEEADMEGLALRYITLRKAGEEVRQNFYFFARLKKREKALFSNEGQLKWCTREEMMQLPMPFTARFVVEHYFEGGRYTACLYGGVADEKQVHFIPMEKEDRV